MPNLIDIYKDGQLVAPAPAFYAEGRPVIEMSESQYNAETTHVTGAIYIIWED